MDIYKKRKQIRRRSAFWFVAALVCSIPILADVFFIFLTGPIALISFIACVTYLMKGEMET